MPFLIYISFWIFSCYLQTVYLADILKYILKLLILYNILVIEKWVLYRLFANLTEINNQSLQESSIKTLRDAFIIFLFRLETDFWNPPFLCIFD